MKLKTGQWYPSRDKIRKYYGEYWKGILLKRNEIAVILNYRGAKRKHYDDYVDLENGMIFYLGEGKTGDQQENARNRALIELAGTKKTIKIYFDCGDIFTPKHLLYMGDWCVDNFTFIKIKGSKKYYFQFSPGSNDAKKILYFQFGTQGKDGKFEKSLISFAKSREHVYKKFSHILRARDSIAGEIGEYFAISRFNESYKSKPLIRLHGSNKDIDAVQIKSGKTYAIKTIGKYPATTSNIWSKDIVNAVDFFIIVHLDPFKLCPIFIVMISTKMASNVGLQKDKYQGSYKLRVNQKLLKKSKFLFGDKNKWLS